MKFDLVAPCSNCPFLKKGGVRLRRERMRGIAEGMLVEGGGSFFVCHKTAGVGGGKRRRRKDYSHCAGALVFAQNNGVQTQLMQVAERVGFYDPAQLRGHRRVFSSLRAALAAQEGGR